MKKCGCSIRVFFMLLFATLLFASSVLAASENYRPYLHKPSVGQHPKLQIFGNYQTQLFSGSASYSYNFIVPPGVNGIAPELSLSYNSQTAFQNPSVVGAGWALTPNYILRNINATVVNTNDDYFILYLNGYSDKIVYRNGQYTTDINAYLRVENKTAGEDQYWVITSPDGTRYTFGQNTTATIDSTARRYVLKWFLESVEDSHGNPIIYNYTKNPYSGDVGAMYLSEIRYNKDQLRKITFTYESSLRPDRRLVYEQGSQFLETRRLEGINMYFDDDLVRRYQFKYTNLTSEDTMSSLLSIQYIGADDSSTLHEIAFDYYGEQPGFANSSRWIMPEEFTSLDSGSQDFGLRLVDVDNDGFMDLVKSNATSNSTRLNDKNTTWVSTSLFSVPEQIVDSSNKYQGVTFVDVNKDGLVDVLKAKNGTARKTYLNNGSAWILAPSPTWDIPVDFINSSSGDEGVQFVELNGDGFIDIVQGKTSGSLKRTWLNNGTGWNSTSLWVLPDYFISVDGNDTGLREIDFNSDGLTDLLKGGNPGSAWFNNGTGWTKDTRYDPYLDFTNATFPDLGVRFMDINGDNLPDILQNFYSNVSFLNQTCMGQNGSIQNCTLYTVNNITNVKINNGSGWVLSGVWQSPESFTYNGFNTGRRIADVNGDGYSDILIGFKNGSVEKRTLLRNATSSFVLKSIRNEYGGRTSILYSQSTLFANGQNLGFNLWLARNITLNNSLSGTFAVIGKTGYQYAGGRFDYPNAEFLGFSTINETLSDGSLVAHSFHQNTPLKGKEHTTTIYTSQGARLTQTLNQYSNTSNNTVHLDATSELRYEGNPTPVITNTTYAYDSFGNILSVTYLGDVAVTGDEKYETYAYIYNVTRYVMNKPTNYTLENASFEVLKRSWFSYDQLADDITKGDLTKIIRYNNNGESPETNYVYDDYGNLITEIDPYFNQMTYVIDSFDNTFIIGKINALGHKINYTYDRGTGNILSETKDGIAKNYTYDTFGRLTKEFMTPDTLSSPTKNITYEFNGISPEKITTRTKNNATDYGESIYFYDGFSNPVQVRLQFNPSTQIVQNYLYDGKSRIIEEQIPSFQAYSSAMNNSSTGFNTRYGYDALDRVVNITKQDLNISRTIFNSTKVVTINELGIQKEYVLDGYGRIISVLEHNRNSSGSDEVYNTSYTYDASDNLIGIVDAQGNNFTFDFDSLGRKIRIDDPNMEPWFYTYDLNGNLETQRDGRLVDTLITYDPLNRPLVKSSGNSSVRFSYDAQFNGTLSSINYTTYFFDQVLYEYVYDNRSRVIQEKLYLDYVPDNVGLGQATGNYWMNTTFEYDSSDRIIKKYLPNQTFDYRFITGANISVEKTFPNATLIFEYNSLNKLAKIQDFVSTVNYNAFANTINKTYTNGLTTEYGYDAINRINRITTDGVQNLSYMYDAAGNIRSINDTKNKMLYSMNYDDLDRLLQTLIYNYQTYEHERCGFSDNKIGGLIASITDDVLMNYTYNATRAHAPITILQTNRANERIEISLVNPVNALNVTRYQLFNFTAQTCCKDNDCWGINVSLDPEGITYSPNSETICEAGVCNSIYYSQTQFVYEDEQWKPIEEAQSLMGVWDVSIDEDTDFPITIVGYNYTSITINLSVSSEKLNEEIPLQVYLKGNPEEPPKDSEGNPVDKDSVHEFESTEETETVTIDFSDTIETPLTQELKWGDQSTIITVHDNNSINLGDSYIQSNQVGSNFGTMTSLIIRNSSTDTRDVLIKFSLQNIPRNALIDAASLHLNLDANGLSAGDQYNVSLFSINQSYLWTETGITWNNRPQGTNITLPALDKRSIGNGITGYLSWNVTSAVRNKNRNESFYLTATENQGGVATEGVQFRSKEATNNRPYLNVTYRLKNLVSTTVGETPFYTLTANPYFVDLEQNQCQNTTWVVNATGTPGTYIFFAYANKTAQSSIGNVSALVDINII